MAGAARAAARPWEESVLTLAGHHWEFCVTVTPGGVRPPPWVCVGRVVWERCVLSPHNPAELHGGTRSGRSQVLGVLLLPVQLGSSGATGCCAALGLLRRLLCVCHWTCLCGDRWLWISQWNNFSCFFLSFGALAAKSEGSSRPRKGGSCFGAGTGSSQARVSYKPEQFLGVSNGGRSSAGKHFKPPSSLKARASCLSGSHGLPPVSLQSHCCSQSSPGCASTLCTR